jgi:hypothetical protein
VMMQIPDFEALDILLESTGFWQSDRNICTKQRK